MNYRNVLMVVSAIVLAIGVALIVAGSILMADGIHKRNGASQACATPTPIPTKQTTTTSKHAFTRDQIPLHIQQNINPDSIKQNLRDFTQEPHVAGSEANQRVANSIVQKWQAAGLQDVHTLEYNVMLSNPADKANYMYIKDINGKTLYKSEGYSPVINAAEQSSSAAQQWLAFSPAATATGPVVYCGQGTVDDFQYLAQQNISLKGAIALLRYGHSFRGDKVRLAQEYGAVGAILYSDPAECAKNGTDEADVYENTIYMPPHGVQRGTVYTGDGDPLSPLYPSKQNLYKYGSVEQSRESGELPSIPVVPISYTSAREIMKRMNTINFAPKQSSFQGGLNVTYYLGPGLTNGATVTVEVHGTFDQKIIRNVVGYIYGSEEPDRYVIMGNHYDAWVYGSLDPNAGTAVLAEIARATMQTMNETNWRPARTLMFINWDAEEYGLFGSTEFAEEFASILSRRALAYINMDCLKGNDTLYVQASPSLNDVVYDAAKKVQSPKQSDIDANRTTAYDTWLYYYPDDNDLSIPYISVPQGGSDHKTIIDYLGIPSVNFYWVDINQAFTYPLYHTMYETPFTNEHLVDTNNFAVHKALGEYWIQLAVTLADQPTVPYSFSALVNNMINDYIPSLLNSTTSVSLSGKSNYTAEGIYQINMMSDTVNQLRTIVMNWENQTHGYTFEDAALLRSRINDKMISFEQCFVNPRGTPNDPTARHVLFSVSKTDSYNGQVMQQLYAVLNEIASTSDNTQLQQLSRDFAQQISIVHYSFQCAQSAIAPFI